MFNDVYSQSESQQSVSALTPPKDRVKGNLEGCPASDLAIYALKGQHVTYDSELTKPLEAIKHHRYQQYICDELSDASSLLDGLLKEKLIDKASIKRIFKEAKQPTAQADKTLAQVFNDSLSSIMTRLEKDTLNILKIKDVSERLLGVKNTYRLYGLGVINNESDGYGLTLYANDFMQHINSELLSVEHPAIQKLYANLLKDMLKFAGIWQHDLIHYFDMRISELEEIRTEEEMIGLSLWLEKIETSEPEKLLKRFQEGIDDPVTNSFVLDIFYALEMQFEVSNCDTQTWIEHDESIKDTITEIVNVSSYGYKINTLKCNDTLPPSMTEKEQKVYGVLEDLTKAYRQHFGEKLEANHVPIPESFQTVGESVEFLGFVVQADNNAEMGYASQGVYEDQMNCGESDEIYALDLTNKNWYSDLLNFTLAINTLLLAIDAVDDLLPETTVEA